jgi:hypothetical protein
LENPPSGTAQVPLSASVAKIYGTFPCSVLPLFHMRPLVVADLDIVVHVAQGQAERSK